MGMSVKGKARLGGVAVKRRRGMVSKDSERVVCYWY